MDWQPIETAPREDEDHKILAYDERNGGDYCVVWLSWLIDDGNKTKWYNGDTVFYCTHWMPLPAPPKHD